MNPVQIIGGGITGLTAAWRLQSLRIPFELFESSDRVGGVIRTQMADGFLVESGPNTILETSSDVTDLIGDLGLEARRVYPSALAANRYVVHQGVPLPLPRGPLDAATTPLLSVRGKLRVAVEAGIPRRHADGDESLASFVQRRFGKDLLDSLIDPFVAGVYAGLPGQLSVQHAFPKLYALERDYGSVIRGAIQGRHKRRQSKTKSRTTANMFSFDEGLGVLPATLYDRLRSSIHLKHRICEIRPHPARPVLICAPAHAIANLLPGTDMLQEISYAPVARVALGFRREQVHHPLNGFGVLVPSREDFSILGVFFSSSLFPHRAPAGKVLLTVFAGGARRPDLPNLPNDQIEAIAFRDVSRLLGIEGAATFTDVEINHHAIPQYNVGFAKLKQGMDDLERQHPGLFLAGAYRDGVSVSDCISAGFRAADRIAESVLNGNQNRATSDQHRVA